MSNHDHNHKFPEINLAANNDGSGASESSLMSSIASNNTQQCTKSYASRLLLELINFKQKGLLECPLLKRLLFSNHIPASKPNGDSLAAESKGDSPTAGPTEDSSAAEPTEESPNSEQTEDSMSSELSADSWTLQLTRDTSPSELTEGSPALKLSAAEGDQIVPTVTYQDRSIGPIHPHREYFSYTKYPLNYENEFVDFFIEGPSRKGVITPEAEHFEVRVLHPSGELIDFKIKLDTAFPYRYMCTFQADKPGTYPVSVKFRNQDINGSPFTCMVSKNYSILSPQTLVK